MRRDYAYRGGSRKTHGIATRIAAERSQADTDRTHLV